MKIWTRPDKAATKRIIIAYLVIAVSLDIALGHLSILRDVLIAVGIFLAVGIFGKWLRRLA